MNKFAEHIQTMPSRRNPPYRPVPDMTEADWAELSDRIGEPSNYEGAQLRELIQADPDNVEFRRALVANIASPEYAGVDAFSRKVVEWQDWPVPWTLIMAIARQTWDEVRHAWLATQLLESYGGRLEDYPDTFAGGAQRSEAADGPISQMMQSPVATLSMVNVSLEGRGLTFFEQISKLGERIGDGALEHCYDYNWADELTHVTIGDFFVKLLCRDNPDEERRALRAHAFFEYFFGQRASLSEEQTQELKDFFAEEMERAKVAFGGAGQPAAH